MATRRWRVEWTDAAWAELDQALDYIARLNPDAAERTAVRIDAATDTLEIFGLSGRVVPGQTDPALRELIVSPYRVVYQVEETRIVIVAFLHGSMDFWSRFTGRPSNQE